MCGFLFSATNVMGFHIALPSDSSMMYFPKNKMLGFTTKLLHEIVLDGEWECGLTEVHYLLTFHNVVGDEISLIRLPNKNFQLIIYVTPGHYTKGDVGDTINKFIK